MADCNRLGDRSGNLVPRLISYLLALYVALAPAAAFAFSPNDLGFDSLRNWGSLPEGGKGDYHFKTAAGEKYSKLGHSVTNSELGGVWRNRWVRGGLWGMAGVAAVAAALSAVDWILDPANNRIYKKQISENGSLEFSPASSLGNPNINCNGPYPSVQQVADCLQNKIRSFKEEYSNYYVKIEYPSDYQSQIAALKIGQSTTIYNFFVYYRESGEIYHKTHLQVKKVGETTETEVDATEQDIADAVQRAEQSSPGTKEALAKPDAEPQGAHGPTEKAKQGAQPDNPNPDKCKSMGMVFDPAKNQCVKLGTNPNPTTDFPDFCTWASSLCDWLKWTKEEPSTPTASETTVDVKKRDETDFGLPGTVDSGRVRFSGQCPAPLHASFSLMGTGVNFDYSFDAVCDFATKLKPAVIGCAALSAAYIVMGQNRTRSE